MREQQVGVYEVTVLRATEGNPLLDWLRERDFPVDEGDIPVLDAHISRGGCFVTARINPASHDNPKAVQHDGLAAPLIFQFAAEQPFYPLALTGTGGHETEVLIYLLSDKAWDAGDRLTLRYAGILDSDELGVLKNLALADTRTAENPDFLEGIAKGLTRLHKFKSRLSPGQMREDLIFTPAPGQQDYRERVFRW